MSTEEDPNETENDLRTYQMVYRTASRETVTECHRETVETTTKRWLPDCLEWRVQELRIIGSPLPKAPTGMFTKWLTELDVQQPYGRAISLLGRCRRRMNITTDGHRVRATGCKGSSDKSRLADQAMHEGSGERKRAWKYMVWMPIVWEAYEIDTRSCVIDHYRQLWYREQKLPKQQ